MKIQEQHYDIKFKLNKVDSQEYRNLLIPEIDWALNEAAEVFVKMVAQPRSRTLLGFEKSRRNIDDIRSIVVPDKSLTLTESGDNYIAELPTDYWFFVKGHAVLAKQNCSTKATILERQHDDEFEESPFDRSSFEWREINSTFNENGMKLYTDGTFNVSSASMTYLKRMPYMHYASGFRTGTYTLPGGEVLTATQDCVLPDSTHREIVDIAVLILSGQLQIPGYQTSFNKLKMNNLT